MKINIKILPPVLFVCANFAFSEILYVGPGGYPTIQHGLNAAATGDTVLVAPALYYQSILWPNTQSIYLVSEDGPDSTIIDGQNLAPIITMNFPLDSTTIIDGFTISNGTRGIICENGSSPIIKNNKILGNSGSGIFCFAASPIITGNLISRNKAADGAGIYCAKSYPYAMPKIIGNTISGDTAWFSGGGILCHEGADATITDNVISCNNAGYSGGGIYCCIASPVEFKRNTITNNTAESGAGISLYFCYSTIRENIITGNSATNIGGAIDCSHSSPLITMNTISNNSADTVGGIYSWALFEALSPVINYNNIFGNGWGVYNATTVIVTNAENNWWGHETGPYHALTNPLGQGDTVSDRVDFDPWLNSPMGVDEEKETTIEPKAGNLKTTIIKGPLHLPREGHYRIFDIAGRTLAPDQMKPGIYFIQINGRVTQKLIKVR
jgi:parallel beta-helix repeat protein